jgi:hypothetical protein
MILRVTIALRWIATAALALAFSIAFGCDRNLEPLVPGEQPRIPDLSKIFPEPVKQQEPQARRGAAPVGSQNRGTAPPIQGRIELAPELAGEIPVGSVLFIMARRTGEEAGPPLAVHRVAAPQLPFDFEIGPGDTMGSSARFAGELQITARLDSDGNPTTLLPGDIQGVAAESHTPGSDGVSIVLDRRL